MDAASDRRVDCSGNEVKKYVRRRHRDFTKRIGRFSCLFSVVLRVLCATSAFSVNEIPRNQGKVALRKSESCLAVEMEAAAMFAVAKFRRVQIGQILYGGDNLDGDAWDSRKWSDNWSVREKLILLAAEAVMEI